MAAHCSIMLPVLCNWVAMLPREPPWLGGTGRENCGMPGLVAPVNPGFTAAAKPVAMLPGRRDVVWVVMLAFIGMALCPMMPAFSRARGFVLKVLPIDNIMFSPILAFRCKSLAMSTKI